MTYVNRTIWVLTRFLGYAKIVAMKCKTCEERRQWVMQRIAAARDRLRRLTDANVKTEAEKRPKPTEGG